MVLSNVFLHYINHTVSFFYLLFFWRVIVYQRLLFLFTMETNLQSLVKK